jgi:hypothetical protein
MDVDSSGWVDMEDLLSFLPFLGHTCPVEWHDTTYNHILGLVLTEWEVHEMDLVGIDSDLPAGSVTYRLYVQLSDIDDIVLAGYGNENTPLNIEADGTFYGFGSVSIGNTVVMDDYNPNFAQIFPAHEYSTWFTTGLLSTYSPQVSWIFGGVDENWTDQEIDSVIQISDSTGGGWFVTNQLVDNPSGGLALLGQFTVVGGSTLEGSINILVETNTEVGHAIELGEGLTFTTDNLTVLGCTEQGATNYNPDATLSFGLCIYLGDVDEDGSLTISDLLLILSQFGCTDCLLEDLDGDEIITVQDILMFLTLI